MAEAEQTCSRQIEKLAAYQAEWTNGFLERKFTRYGWLEQKDGTLRYAGDRLKFQNGFGAWQNQIYICRYDPLNSSIISVDVGPGTL